MKSINKYCLTSLILLIFILFMLPACNDDETPDGDWSEDIADGDSVLPDGDIDPDTEIPSDGDADISDSDITTSDGDSSDSDIDTDNAVVDSDEDDSDYSAVDSDTDAEEDSDGDIDADSGQSAHLAVALPSYMAVGQSIGLKAWIYNTGKSEAVDVSKFVNWTATAAADSVEIDNSAKTLKALSLAAVELEAVYTPDDIVQSAGGEIEIKPRNQVEARGLWVNRWAFNSAQSVTDIINKAADAGFNQIYFQVRGVFDAYYQSAYEPWAKGLSGTLGGDPGWDPLQSAIEAAHARGLELHAWINVFTFWSSATAPAESTPRHMYLAHPEWIMENSSHVDMSLTDGYVWASPGNAELLAHNAAVVTDIISNYDVDGIHLDRVRYPGSQYSYDAASEAAYAAAHEEDPELTWLDWERSQVVRQVAMIYDAIQETSPQVVLSAAVCGIYKNIWSWSSVTEGYSQWLQDTRAMTDQGVLDVAMPMIYWAIESQYGARTDFAALVDDHVANANGRFVFAGSDLDANGDTRERAYSRRSRITYVTWTQINAQIEYTRSAGAEGWALYDYGTLDGADYWDELAAGPFAETALPPLMWWKLKPVVEE